MSEFKVGDRVRMKIRQPNWRQDTPRQQVVSLVQSAQGDVMNVVAGDTKNVERALKRALEALEQAQSILRDYMPEGEW